MDLKKYENGRKWVLRYYSNLVGSIKRLPNFSISCKSQPFFPIFFILFLNSLPQRSWSTLTVVFFVSMIVKGNYRAVLRWAPKLRTGSLRKQTVYIAPKVPLSLGAETNNG